MISFSFVIDNPFSKKWQVRYNRAGLFSAHKAWEFNTYTTHQLIDISGHWTIKGDHAGFRLMLGLFGYAVEFHTYDTRHWDCESNSWEKI